MSIQNLTSELVTEYKESKYDKKYLKEKVNEILDFVIPEISEIIKNKEERELVKLWNNIKENGEIESLFRKLTGEIDRPIVIYVASKFENNQYFGTKIIGEALK